MKTTRLNIVWIAVTAFSLTTSAATVFSHAPAQAAWERYEIVDEMTGNVDEVLWHTPAATTQKAIPYPHTNAESVLFFYCPKGLMYAHSDVNDVKVKYPGEDYSFVVLRIKVDSNPPETIEVLQKNERGRFVFDPAATRTIEGGISDLKIEYNSTSVGPVVFTYDISDYPADPCE